MKTNVPWSVKGIDPEARVVAKEAARKAGMTLGEWMNTMIRDLGSETSDPDAVEQASTKTGVSPDQLRAVVDSLNRLNERLKTTEENLKRTEEKSREAVGGLNHGLESVFERIKRIEKTRVSATEGNNGTSASNASATAENRERIASLKALENALSQMLTQFDAARKDTLHRVSANENAVSNLNQRVDVLDQKVNAGFEEVRDAMSAVGQHLDQTERTAKAVMVEARNASTTNDAEFIERTGKKLQLLGNEIKRSGDQIAAVEAMVTDLSSKIEGAEQRSAEGISEVASELNLLRDDIAPALESANNSNDPTLKAAAVAAEETVASLQKSYEEMIARMEGRLPLGPPPTNVTMSTPVQPLMASTEAKTTASLESDIAATPQVKPQDAVRAAVASADLTLPGDNDTLVRELAENNVADPDAEFDAVFGNGTELLANSDVDDTSFNDAADSTLEKTVSPREKILAAARARKERALSEQTADEVAAKRSQDSDLQAVAGETRTPEGAADIGNTIDGTKSNNQNRRLGLPILALLGICVLSIIAAAAWFFGRGDTPTPQPVTTDQTTPDATPTSDTTPPVVDTIDKTPDTAALYARAKQMMTAARTDQDRVAAFNTMREAAIYGHVPAQYRLGEMHFSGLGTPQNFRESKRWFESAAQSGNAVAMHRLGSLAIDPNFEGAKHDIALDWFGRAASYGVVDSMYNLGYLYDPGSDPDLLPLEMRNAELSYRWLRIASLFGDDEAAIDAASVGARLSPGTVNAIDAEIAQWQPLPVDPRVNDGLAIAQ